MDEFLISYDAQQNAGLLSRTSNNISSGWSRILSYAINLDSSASGHNQEVRLEWYQLLSIVREFVPLQKQLNFRFVTDESSRKLINNFVEEQRITNAARNGRVQYSSPTEIEQALAKIGFTERELKEFQKRDVAKLVSISNGANFSVPGAGKTTVALAVHLLTTSENDKMLVVCPKSAFVAWSEIVKLCVTPNAGWPFSSGSFVNLSGLSPRGIVESILSDNRYFVTNYEQFAIHRDTFAYILTTQRIHLVLDESHRMKAGEMSQRGQALLSVANLPIRRDILSGTPMPQGAADLQSQLDFLWPGSSFGLRIQQGARPSEVVSGLYTRTTKEVLNLPPVTRNFIHVPMSSGQAALYGVVKNETLRQLSSFRDGRGSDIIKARKSVMRLLQLCSNPILAIRSISEDIHLQNHKLMQAVLEERISPKMAELCRLVQSNAIEGKKTVVWTIFTQNIIDLEKLLANLSPVSIYGAIDSGDATDLATREGRLRKFHTDSTCKVLIANPAAAGEGISLHEVCHDAIYLDRSYISTHYLQSIDRIHRLGLLPNQKTTITILQAAPPSGIGSIDYSVSRRLAIKIRALQALLNDQDLHLIALDEESAPAPVDYELDLDDIADIIEELEGIAKFDEKEAL